jgi:hypothetical protein
VTYAKKKYHITNVEKFKSILVQRKKLQIERKCLIEVLPPKTNRKKEKK